MRRTSIDSNCADRSGRAMNFDSVLQAVHRFLHASAGVTLLSSVPASAQELEPRAYSAVPVGANFVVLDYARSSGGALLDRAIPITGLQAIINTYSLGYSHSFGVAGHVASIAVSVPYADADLNGNVEGAPGHAYRSGAGDVRFRISVNLLGGPALTPKEFARQTPTTILGTSLSVVAPTGQYVPSRVINVGSNRWSFKPVH